MSSESEQQTAEEIQNWTTVFPNQANQMAICSVVIYLP
jgi:hypothetical protein